VPELPLRFEARIALAHPIATLVKIEFDRELLVVAFEIRILGRMPGAADRRRRAEQGRIPAADDRARGSPRRS
jgi:hypothetical protein